jgi:protein-disulfide isomerase
MAVCAVFMVGTRAREFFRADPSKPRRIDGAEVYAFYGHRMGPKDAKVQIVEFADYQCPFCRQADSVLTQLRARYPNSVSVVYRHYPLSIHDSAVASARVAECAAEAGKFEEMHHTLFRESDKIGKESWAWFAERAGLGGQADFDACIDSSRQFAAITRDVEAAKRLDINSTPTFLINTLRVTGFVELDQLIRYVEAEID